MKKWLLFLVPIIVFLPVYFGLYHKNKELKYIPYDADAVVLIDVKKLTRDYLSQTLSHPSTWFEKSESKGKKSWLKSGVKIPDFVQFFHLKNDSFSSWHTVLEIKDKEEFFSFLKDQNFQNKSSNLYTNGNFSLKIDGEICILGTSEKFLPQIESSLKSNKNILNADDFMGKGVGSLGIIDSKKIEKYAIILENNFIEISSYSGSKSAENVLSESLKSTDFTSAQLDQKNIKIISKLFKTDLFSHPEINSLDTTVDLKQVTDTIISYDYDNNFNEVEKISYQKIAQPQYYIQLKTKNPDAVWTDFKSKNQINEKNQFTAIPFLPNAVLQIKDNIVIHSKQYPTLRNQSQKNFILIKNNPLLLSSIKSLSASDRKKLSKLDYIFYHNDEAKRVLRLQFRPNKLPLILQ